MTHQTYSVVVQEIAWLSSIAYEATLSRPDGFSFIPGQRIRFVKENIQREYTIISSPNDPFIKLCVRHIAGGQFSTRLAKASPGDGYCFNGPHGYFRYTTTGHQVVFIATGTGIAPFVSFARNHVTGFIMLHGVSGPPERYYKDILQPAAALYVPCYSTAQTVQSSNPDIYHGRVTQYINDVLPIADYDFYLCGNGDMIADAMSIIDDRFPNAKVFTESFT